MAVFRRWARLPFKTWYEPIPWSTDWLIAHGWTQSEDLIYWWKWRY